MSDERVKQLERMEVIGQQLEQKRILNIVKLAFNNSFLKSKGEILIEIVQKIIDNK